MKGKSIAIILVLVGLGLGATLLRDQVPVSSATIANEQASLTKTETSAKLQNEQNTIEIVQKYEPGLVYIGTEQDVTYNDPFGWLSGGGSQTQVQRGVGSGFFVNEAGDILTNYHVVAGEGGTGAASRINIRTMGSVRSVPAKVIGLAPQYDLALIRAEGLDRALIKPIPLGNSDALQVGQKVIAMGAPFGLDFSVSEGIVSSASRQIPIGFSASGSGQGITQNAIQTDAAINPGNSGGPLLDSGGRVIGINTQIYSPSGQTTGVGQSAGVGFAIPINAAKNLLPRLQGAQGGLVSAPTLGIVPGLAAQTRQGTLFRGISALNSSAKQQLGLPDAGLVIGSVTPNTPAARAGLQGGNQTQQFPGGYIRLGGDIIVMAGDKPVDTLEDLQAMLINKKVGDSLTLQVVKGGQTRQVKVTLDESAFR